MDRRDFIKKTMTSSIALAGSSLFPFSQSSAISIGQNEYEFIIVGSGAGGGPLAVNLAKAGFSVLLIEAGGDKLPLSAQIPAYHPVASEDPEISWDFFVRHYDNDKSHGKWSDSNDKAGILYPRSSVIGGCTTHNAMICLYPDHDDWEQIFQAVGSRDKTWKSSHMRKIFNERIENGQYFSDSKKGWQSLEMSPLSLLRGDSQLQRIVFSALRDGPGLLDDLSNAGQNLAQDIFKVDSYLNANSSYLVEREGFLRIPKATYMGKRHGVFEHVTEAAKRYPNLKIMPHTLVKQVLFEETDDGLKAIGVEALQGKNLYGAHKLSDHSVVRKNMVLKAHKEVILCGGAFNSPQTLMLSGIGPADQYDSMTSGAPIKQNPKLILDGVGRNLQDRYEVSVVTELDKELDLLKNCDFQTDFKAPTTDRCLKDWMNEATRENSVYASNGLVASIKMKSSFSQNKKTDLLLFGTPGDFRGYYPGYSKDAYKHKDRFTWSILKGHSRNRKGRVQLKSDNCQDTPEINFNYFEGEGAEEDLNAVLEGLKKVRSINRNSFDSPYQRRLRANKWEQINSSRAGKGELYPGRELRTDSDLKSWIQREAWGHHASCSNKMGIDPKDGSVVNGDFKVHGTTNLRVVDASVFPSIPGLFIVTPVYMISEKASDVILRKYGK